MKISSFLVYLAVTMLVLASQSPRRREILTAAGIPFSVRASSVAEIHAPGEVAEVYVRRLAFVKAHAVKCAPGEVILAADTTVVIDDDSGAETLLEKPVDSNDARRMLTLLAGRHHRVVTGICLLSNELEVTDASVTQVHFASLSSTEISDYAATGEPMDKAGGYGIQGLASKFVESIEGCYFNVMGLPIALVYRHLKRFQ